MDVAIVVDVVLSNLIKISSCINWGRRTRRPWRCDISGNFVRFVFSRPKCSLCRAVSGSALFITLNSRNYFRD